MARSQPQDPNLQNARARLAALREKKPPTKAALEAGHSLKSVCESLEADGINITVPALGSYVTRIRRKSPQVVAPPAPAAIASATRQNDPGKLAETADPKHDPLANIRERKRKVDRFRLPAGIGRPERADLRVLDRFVILLLKIHLGAQAGRGPF